MVFFGNILRYIQFSCTNYEQQKTKLLRLIDYHWGIIFRIRFCHVGEWNTDCFFQKHLT
jgi:hypothetical protein